MPDRIRRYSSTGLAIAGGYAVKTYIDPTGVNATTVNVDHVPFPRSLAQIQAADSGEIAFWFGPNRTSTCSMSPASPDAYEPGKQFDHEFGGTQWAETNLGDLTAVLESDGDLTVYPSVTTVQEGAPASTGFPANAVRSARMQAALGLAGLGRRISRPGRR